MADEEEYIWLSRHDVISSDIPLEWVFMVIRSYRIGRLFVVFSIYSDSRGTLRVLCVPRRRVILGESGKWGKNAQICFLLVSLVDQLKELESYLQVYTSRRPPNKNSQRIYLGHVPPSNIARSQNRVFIYIIEVFIA